MLESKEAELMHLVFQGPRFRCWTIMKILGIIPGKLTGHLIIKDWKLSSRCPKRKNKEMSLNASQNLDQFYFYKSNQIWNYFVSVTQTKILIKIFVLQITNISEQICNIIKQLQYKQKQLRYKLTSSSRYFELINYKR